MCVTKQSYFTACFISDTDRRPESTRRWCRVALSDPGACEPTQVRGRRFAPGDPVSPRRRGNNVIVTCVLSARFDSWRNQTGLFGLQFCLETYDMARQRVSIG